MNFRTFAPLAKTRFAGALAALLLAVTAGRAGAEERVPANLTLQLLLKVVSYDQAFADRGSSDFVILIPNSSGESAALSEAVTAAKAAPSKIQNRNIKFVPVTWEGLPAAIAEQQASAILLINGATESEVSGALKAAADKKLYSLTLDPDFVEQGALVGVGAKDGKPQVVIQLNTARETGVNFPSAVLKIARTVH
jgi:hypothetical protein